MQKELAGAQSEFLAAVQCDPGSARAQNNLGAALLYYRREVENAIEHLRAAVNSQPGFALARMNLGKALAAKQDFSGAEPELRAAFAIDPDLAAAHLNLGLVLATMQGTMSPGLKKNCKRDCVLIHAFVPRSHGNMWRTCGSLYCASHNFSV